MSETKKDNIVKINCLGKKCPRPIIEIAKAARLNPPGTILYVIADDMAFEPDVYAWINTTGARIMEFNKNTNDISVKIKL